eukprot:3035264-Rhodomonas_salina.1
MDDDDNDDDDDNACCIRPLLPLTSAHACAGAPSSNACPIARSISLTCRPHCPLLSAVLPNADARL